MPRYNLKLTAQAFGALGQDPTGREVTTASGTDFVCNFSIAVNRPYTDNENVRHPRTDWIKVAAWGGLGRTCQQWLKKGREVIVEGVPQARGWMDSNNELQTQIEITANQVVFCRSGNGASPEQPVDTGEEPDDAEIPF